MARCDRILKLMSACCWRVLVLWLSAVILAGCGVETHRLTMVTPRLDIDQQIAEDFARLFDDPGDIQIELVPNPDPDQPGRYALQAGHADLALVSNTEAYDPHLTTVVPLYPTVLHILYRVGGTAGFSVDEEVSDITPLLTTHTVFAGPPGSPSRQLLEASVRRNGFPISEINYIDSGTACADVVVIFAPVMPDIPDRIRPCGDYRLYSLGRPEDLGAGLTVDAVALLNPQLKPFVIPQGTYDELTPRPIVTLAVDKLLVASRDLSETAVYDLLRELLRMKPALSASHPGLFHQLTDDFDISGSAFVIHPGALAYVQRDEPGVLERYSGIAEVAVTLLIGLVSGIYAVYRIFTIRRKNRIDAFCKEAIDIRDQLDGTVDEAQKAEAVARIKSLQDRAYRMMIEEKLAADESFRIFITLCNDIIADISATQRERRT